MQLPPAAELPPVVPGAVDPIADAVGALASAAAALPLAPITLPAIVVPFPGAGAGGAGIAPRSGPRSAPNASGAPARSQPKSGQENPTTYSASNGTATLSYRAGYGEYLRGAGLGQIAAVAVPGVMGMLLLTGAGGLLGYRQARAGHAVRANGTARFMG